MCIKPVFLGGSLERLKGFVRTFFLRPFFCDSRFLFACHFSENMQVESALVVSDLVRDMVQTQKDAATERQAMRAECKEQITRLEQLHKSQLDHLRTQVDPLHGCNHPEHVRRALLIARNIDRRIGSEDDENGDMFNWEFKEALKKGDLLPPGRERPNSVKPAKRPRLTRPPGNAQCSESR
jgi:hypothetical protein